MLEKYDLPLAHYIRLYLDTLSLSAPIGSFELVAQLQKQHLATYSFSSINAMQGAYLSLEAEALFERLITKRQGGYCFEHNRIMYLVLEALGYDVKPALARVMLNGRTDNPRTHRVTLLRFGDKTYTIEVGFGVKAPIVPIEINRNQVVIEGVNQYEVLCGEGTVTISQTVPETISLYQIDLAEVFEGDCEVGHFYSHQHFEAAFVNNLVVSRIEDGQRYLIRNDSFIHMNEQTGAQIQQTIHDVSQLKDLLSNYMGVQASDAYLAYAFDKVQTRITRQS
ncbi:arylamine N-acetyltransferase family protein [Pseudoalteromonas sp. S16_S37]|uniref:arylamine N-acetyltransferase family protein n=1 Tax=Pseudoalteromonas sp. S16_S37 TaxID=2720228 RepID=UPI001681B213|nr:arylamine N-acetyltransferase [Pseudoalteromonas sp. S16_S37]MBD1583347.1 arylamine N-acetyltransferase [Pseudoalteromonas sp. S16_S37]